MYSARISQLQTGRDMPERLRDYENGAMPDGSARRGLAHALVVEQGTAHHLDDAVGIDDARGTIANSLLRPSDIFHASRCFCRRAWCAGLIATCHFLGDPHGGTHKPVVPKFVGGVHVLVTHVGAAGCVVRLLGHGWYGDQWQQQPSW